MAGIQAYTTGYAVIPLHIRGPGQDGRRRILRLTRIGADPLFAV